MTLPTIHEIFNGRLTTFGDDVVYTRYVNVYVTPLHNEIRIYGRYDTQEGVVTDWYCVDDLSEFFGRCENQTRF